MVADANGAKGDDRIRGRHQRHPSKSLRAAPPG
jgi:hypothetical protein